MFDRRAHVLCRKETDHLIRRDQDANPPESGQGNQP